MSRKLIICCRNEKHFFSSPRLRGTRLVCLSLPGELEVTLAIVCSSLSSSSITSAIRPISQMYSTADVGAFVYNDPVPKIVSSPSGVILVLILNGDLFKQDSIDCVFSTRVAMSIDCSLPVNTQSSSPSIPHPVLDLTFAWISFCTNFSINLSNSGNHLDILTRLVTTALVTAFFKRSAITRRLPIPMKFIIGCSGVLDSAP
mmetsp:Transcript_32614/g.51982  ORF Transcript_32614/g.51982 Transcript_32614/m.51982 type:complete len:202 (-) Transcript_32614:97-702(-)